jgi:hypothetical protein
MNGAPIMSQETGTSPGKKALLDAFDTVLKTQADEREAERTSAEARRRRRGASRILMVLCATVLVCTSVYLYVERPEWIFAAPPEPESVAVREASLRVEVANAVQHIERYRKQTGQLPTSLQQAGAHGDGVSYERTTAGYRLLGQGDGVRVGYVSGEPLSRFVGNSFEVISRRPR